MGMFYAHSREDNADTSTWQTMAEHEVGVAERAEDFAGKFGAGAYGRLLGLWHDLGKYHPAFQEKLYGASHSFEHAGAGAALAVEKAPRDGVALAFAIAGHHGGLANAKGGDGKPATPLATRLKNNGETLRALRENVPASLLEECVPPLSADMGDRQNARLEFWIRMIFSCLVDADWLDTESFVEGNKGRKRGGYDSIPALQERLDSHVDRLVVGCTADAKTRPTFLVRQAILHNCREAAHWEPGLFSLTAPTGSGKTLSALSFALNHARLNGKDRVIVVIPYTSIIEQNARVYRQALGNNNVLEHHTNLDPQARRDEIGDEITERHELATENWDAPVVVTTTVQFFESLFSNKRGRCRKLHNIANSVVVFDEIQTLPAGFRYPILDAIRELSDHYECSLVLSTATQPALAQRESMKYGLKNVREIVSDPDGAAETLKRVEIEFPALEEASTTWEQLAEQLAGHHQVLAIVHRRADARVLATLLSDRVPDDSVFHLSALMCPKHRLDVLDAVRLTLECGKPCRLVATQLIEAGVDVDFPVVYRALGGLDSIIQAAGRCNREGKAETGRVVVFRAPTTPPPGTPSQGLDVTASMLREDPTLSVHRQETMQRYFQSLYTLVPPDQAGIQGRRKELKFAEVGKKFKLIEDGFTHPIVVPYGVGEDLIEALERGEPSRDLLRSLQACQVSVYQTSRTSLLEGGQVVEVSLGLYGIAREYPKTYHPKYGLLLGDHTAPAAEKLVL